MGRIFALEKGLIDDRLAIQSRAPGKPARFQRLITSFTLE